VTSDVSLEGVTMDVVIPNFQCAVGPVMVEADIVAEKTIQSVAAKVVCVPEEQVNVPISGLLLGTRL